MRVHHALPSPCTSATNAHTCTRQSSSTEARRGERRREEAREGERRREEARGGERRREEARGGEGRGGRVQDAHGEGGDARCTVELVLHALQMRRAATSVRVGVRVCVQACVFACMCARVCGGRHACAHACVPRTGASVRADCQTVKRDRTNGSAAFVHWRSSFVNTWHAHAEACPAKPFHTFSCVASVCPSVCVRARASTCA